MSQARYRTFLLLTLILVVLLAACRRDEEQPTPSPELDTPPADVAEPTDESPATEPPAEAPDTPEPQPPAGQDSPDLTYDWSPQLVYSSPAPGEETALDGAITLRFDQPMDQTSVVEAFQVSPAGGTSAIDGSFQWPRADTVIFTPGDQLERQQIYDVHVADDARGLNGKPLREEVNLQVETVGFLSVGQTIPGDGADEIQTDAVITVAFNRPVVPLVTTGQQADLPQPLSFEPAVSGEGQWVSTSIYRFVPDEPLAGATTYRATVAAGLEDMTGGVLANDHSWTFSTLPPSVVSTFPEPRAIRVLPTGPYTVTFNMPMDRAATEAAISLSPGSSLSYEWDADGRVVSLVPDGQLDRGQAYTLNVAQSARSLSGDASLDRRYEIPFTTVPLPRVVRTDPADGAMAQRFQSGFNVEFASPMDLDTLEDKIDIVPDSGPPPDDPIYWLDNENFNLWINFRPERETEYTVTIPATAADPWGNTLGEDYIFSFTTPPPDPIVSLNLPSQPPVSQLSTSFPSKVDVIYRNVTQIDAELLDVGLPVMDLVLGYAVSERAPQGEVINSWSIPVEPARNAVEVMELQLADGGTLPTGIYYLSARAPQIHQEQRWWQNYRNYIVVADTNLVVKQTPDAVYVWATDLASGEPAGGLQLNFYNSDGQKIGTVQTDGNGLASIAYRPPENYFDGVLVTSNEPGGSGFGAASTNWNRGIDPWQFGVDVRSEAEPLDFLYLYTDRPIYRPGDTVYFKGILRDTNYGRYPLPSQPEVTLKMMFLNNYEEVDFEFRATVDENGEFSGEYEIPEDAALGNYQLFYSALNSFAERVFSVAEYRKPEFQVTVTPSVEETLRGQPVEVLVEAEYFTGDSASDLPVNWSIYEDDFRLPWQGPYYSFSDNADFFYTPGFPFGPGAGTFGNYLQGGSGTTDADGRLVIELPADLLDDVDPGGRTVTVEAEVLDITNFPITSRGSVVFHAADTYVGVRGRNSISTAGLEAEVDLVTVDWDGQPAPESPVEVVFYQRRWEPIRDDDSDLPFTQWEAIDTEVARDSLTTDAQGEGSAAFVPGEGGQYLAVATVTDPAGRTQTSSTSLWIADQNYLGWRSDPKEKRMDLTADQEEYRPGDVARVLVQSPFAGPAEAWLTIERGDVIEQRIITLASASEVLDIPITADYAPNVFMSLAAVKGIDDSNPVPDMRLGLVELVVSPEQLAVDLSLAPQQDLLEPGETVVYDISVTDSQGRPVQASLSLALVDLAVLTLKEDNAPPIVEAFFDRQPMRSVTGSGLIQSGEGLEIEIPQEVLGRGGGGGGGLESVSSVRLEGEEDDVRRDFPDTAFWEAKVVTGPDGRASVEIPLPDSLTTWRLSSKAVSLYEATNETMVGQSAVDVVTKLPLWVRPVTPRFFVVGDELLLGAGVDNNTGQTQEITVSLEADGLTLTDGAERTVSLADGEHGFVQWPVVVDDVPFADLTFRVVAGEFRDASKPTFGFGPDQFVPVVRYAGEDIVGTSGVLDEAGSQVEAILLPESVDERQGEVTVQLSPSLAAALTEALAAVDLQLSEEVACAHTFADELLPNVATAGALLSLNLDRPGLQDELDELVERDVGRLEDLQLRGGGWSYCFKHDPNRFLTAYILFALTKAEQAGYAVPESMIDRAERAVESYLRDADRLNERSEVNAQAFYLYVLAERGLAKESDLEAMFDEHRALMDSYAKALLVMAYELNGGGQASQQSLLADLNDSVVLSATGAHWQDAEPDWNNLSSDIRGTAMVLDALSKVEPASPLAPNAVRWLMSARTAGHWTTSHETAWTILGLADWMAASGELEADYEYALQVNGQQEADGHFGADNLLANEVMGIPVGDLFPDEVNFLDFQRGEGPGRLYYSAHLDSFLRAEGVEAVDRGIIVQRTYYDATCDPEEESCEPIERIEAGQKVRVELTVIVPNDLVYAIIEDPIPSGAEAIDPALETTGSQSDPTFERLDQDFPFGYWGWWYFDRTEFRDDRVVFYSEFLPAGTYQYTYELQAVLPGEYQVIPATARQEFFPEVFGRSDGFLFTIGE